MSSKYKFLQIVEVRISSKSSWNIANSILFSTKICGFAASGREPESLCARRLAYPRQPAELHTLASWSLRWSTAIADTITKLFREFFFLRIPRPHAALSASGPGYPPSYHGNKMTFIVLGAAKKKDLRNCERLTTESSMSLRQTGWLKVCYKFLLYNLHEN